MSVGRPNVQLTLVSEDQYRENQARIEEAQAALDNFKAMNDAAKQAYEKQQELLRKIEEGREADQLAIAGPSTQQIPPAANYNPAWQQYPTTHAVHTQPQSYSGTGNGHISHWQPYAGSSGPQSSFFGQPTSQVQHSSGTRVSQDIPAQQPTRYYQPTPQAAQPTRQELHYAPHLPAAHLPRPAGVSQPSVRNGRTAASTAGQGTAVVNQKRQALSMQPVMQHTLQSNQFQAATHPVNLQPRQSAPRQSASTSKNDHAQYSSHTQAAATVPSVIPNIVNQVFPPRSLHPQPSSAPRFSSIAGALDLPTTNVSASVSSHSTVAPDAKQPPPSSLSVEAARLQEQIAMPKTSSTFSTAPAPVSTTVPSASAGPSNASNSDTPAPMPRPPTGSTTAKTEDLAAFLRKITSHLELMQRLQTNKFAVSAEPKPYFNLPNSTVRIYKDAMERLYVGFSDTSKANGISFVPLETLMKLKDEMKGQQQTQEHSVTPTEPAKTAPAKQVAPAKPVAPANPAASATDAQQVYTDNQGNFVFGPPTLEMSKKFKPYNVPPHPPPLRSRAPMVQEGFKAFRPYVAPPAPSTNTGPQADKTVTAATFRPTSSVSAPAAIPLPGNLPAPSISAPGMAPAPTTFSFTPVMNSVTSTPPLAAEGSPVRTPAQADKKRLAKDVLRALNLTSRKRPQPEASLAHPLEPPAKRHASGLDLQPSSSAGDEPTAASGIELPASIMPTQNSTISLASVQTPRPPGNYYRERVMKDSIDSPSTTGSDLMTVAGNQTVQRRPPGTYYKERPKPSMPPEGTSSMQVPVQTSVSPQRKPMPLPPPKRFPSRPPRPQAAVDQVHAVLSPRATPQSPPPTSRSPTPAAQSESAITPHEPHRSPSLTPPTTVFPVLKRRAKTPLFLPSPSASPFTRPTSGEADIISIDLTLDHAPSTSRKKLRRQPFYILVPPPPAYLVEYRTEQLRKHRRPSSPIVVDDGDTEVEEARSSLSTVDDEDIEIIDTDHTSHGFVNDEAELESVKLSCSRISERSCKWNGCDVVMASAEQLIQHFASAHSRKRTLKGLYVCLWQQCGRHESNSAQLFHHLKSHATIPLMCAYNDCQELFRTPRQLAKHHQTEHINATLKPKAALFRPELEPLPGIPGVVPSYLIEATVQQASISKERHAALGPWVLQNIAGPVNLGVKRYNAASKLTRTPSGEGVRWKANKPYDFLTYPSMNFSTTPSQPSRIRNMVDLESGEVSNLVQDGMVLWAPPPEDDSVLKIEETDEIDEQFSSPVPDQDVDEVEEVEEVSTVEYSRDEETSVIV